MAKKKKLTATQKERKAVNAAIRRAEKQGIRFTDTLKSELKTAGYQKLKSYHRYGFKKLMLSGSAMSESGEVISGFEKRSELRRVAAKKAAYKRQYKERIPEPVHYTPPLEYIPSPSALDDERVRQEKQKQVEEKFAELFSEGKIIEERLKDLIETFSHLGAGRTGEYLTRFMDNEINQYGYETTMQAIAMAPAEYWEEAQAVIFYEHKENELATALNRLTEIMRGSLLDLEEKRELYSTYESETEF